MENHIWTIDLKLAAILISHGVPRRSYDPVTCVQETSGHKQYKFWFNAINSEHEELARKIINAYYANKKIPDCIVVDTEDVLSMQIGVLRWREQLLDEMNKKVTPLICTEVNGKTLAIGRGASEETKQKVRAML